MYALIHPWDTNVIQIFMQKRNLLLVCKPPKKQECDLTSHIHGYKEVVLLRNYIRWLTDHINSYPIYFGYQGCQTINKNKQKKSGKFKEWHKAALEFTWKMFTLRHFSPLLSLQRSAPQIEPIFDVFLFFFALNNSSNERLFILFCTFLKTSSSCYRRSLFILISALFGRDRPVLRKQPTCSGFITLSVYCEPSIMPGLFKTHLC